MEESGIYSSFKVHFDIDQYNRNGWDIIPDIMEYLEDDILINAEELQKGNVDLCVWRREPEPLIITNDFMEREAKRILRTGVFIAIKDKVFWIPPNYYFFLQYFPVGGDPAQFRIKRLKHVYWKIHIRNQLAYIGTYTIKNRQDGETTTEMSDSLWEVADGNMNVGTLGVQSKTNDTVRDSCWRVLKMGWNAIPLWLKNVLFSDYASGEFNETRFKFNRSRTAQQQERDIEIIRGSSAYNGFDSMNNMRQCKLDEVNKWKECSFYKTFLNYKQFIAPGVTRKGLFSMFSSPADEAGKWNDEAKDFWESCDPDQLTKQGVTKSRVARYYSNPLEGIEGLYDKWGDADPEVCLEWIMEQRAAVKDEYKLSEIRANPLNEDEMFGATEGNEMIWANSEGIKKRKIFLINRRFKDDITKEPIGVYGNLEWRNGVIDGEDVDFRQYDKNEFDITNARWFFPYLPSEGSRREPLWDIQKPPRLIENVLGADPFGKRHPKDKKRASAGAMVNWKFLDLYETGLKDIPTMFYLNRPQHEAIFYEDFIKSMIYLRARGQYENITHGVGEYVEDRGYAAWLLPSLGEKEGSKHTGDAPSGKGGFLNEGITLLDNKLNTPLNPEDQYMLDKFWSLDALTDVGDLDPTNTLKSHYTMAILQCMIGVNKMLYRKKKKPSGLNNSIIAALME
jgi:hypothetical protein